MKKQILWLAPYVPYSKVRHAGGKNMNYYINYINDTGRFDITFIGLAYEDERKDVDLDARGIKSDIYYRDNSKPDYIIRRIVSGFTLLNPWTKYYRQLLLYEHMQLSKRVRKYKAAGGNPDIVILHWTSMGLLLPEWKALFPNARFILIEEDVTYLGYQRKYEAEKETAKLDNNIKTKNAEQSWKRLYNGLKRDELTAIKNCDLTVTLNQKDTDLLLKDGISDDKIYTSTLYFDDYSNVERKPIPGKLLYYGAMDRIENYESAIDFIENVMPLLKNENCTLDIVGSKPHPKLIATAEKHNAQYANNMAKRTAETSNTTKHTAETNNTSITNTSTSTNSATEASTAPSTNTTNTTPINITGFVADIRPYLSEAMCLVAPLKLGAGIKVKVLEAMSAGVPVLTNKIGIEGIYAENGKDYIHCENPGEYAEAITKLVNNTETIYSIGSAGKEYIEHNLNLNQKLKDLAELLLA